MLGLSGHRKQCYAQELSDMIVERCSANEIKVVLQLTMYLSSLLINKKIQLYLYLNPFNCEGLKGGQGGGVEGEI